MQNKSTHQSRNSLKIASKRQPYSSCLSDDAFYVMALTSLLKKLLGPASLPHFIATGETIVFTNKAVG